MSWVASRMIVTSSDNVMRKLHVVIELNRNVYISILVVPCALFLFSRVSCENFLKLSMPIFRCGWGQMHVVWRFDSLIKVLISTLGWFFGDKWTLEFNMRVHFWSTAVVKREFTTFIKFWELNDGPCLSKLHWLNFVKNPNYHGIIHRLLRKIISEFHYF